MTSERCNLRRTRRVERYRIVNSCQWSWPNAHAPAGELGHAVVWAKDVVGALLHLNQSASIELLITDIRLDDALLGGCELAKHARELHPRLSVLYVSGQVLVSSARDLFVEDARFLQKPYTPDELQDAVRSLTRHTIEQLADETTGPVGTVAQTDGARGRLADEALLKAGA
eukprot:gene12517-16681_t